jgi:hypothetical protein
MAVTELENYFKIIIREYSYKNYSLHQYNNPSQAYSLYSI